MDYTSGPSYDFLVLCHNLDRLFLSTISLLWNVDSMFTTLLSATSGMLLCCPQFLLLLLHVIDFLLLRPSHSPPLSVHLFLCLSISPCLCVSLSVSLSLTHTYRHTWRHSCFLKRFWYPYHVNPYHPTCFKMSVMQFREEWSGEE